jgi:hypothetical protein
VNNTHIVDDRRTGNDRRDKILGDEEIHAGRPAAVPRCRIDLLSWLPRLSVVLEQQGKEVSRRSYIVCLAIHVIRSNSLQNVNNVVTNGTKITYNVYNNCTEVI